MIRSYSSGVVMPPGVLATITPRLMTKRGLTPFMPSSGASACSREISLSATPSNFIRGIPSMEVEFTARQAGEALG